jgi:NAD(P)H-hydrate epimerase
MCSRLGIEPVWVSDAEELATDAVRQGLESDLIIDAIVGTGFKPPLHGLAMKAVEAINEASGTIISVDMPSGIDADSSAPLQEHDAGVVFAHGIITFIAPRPAHVFGKLTSGPIAVSEIGVQPALVPHSTALNVTTGQEAGITFPSRGEDAHKGEFGHVLVVAGSLGKAGAAALAGMAALSAGAGLVTVACPKSIQATVAGFAPELMTEGLPETAEGSISMEATARVDALLSGKDTVVLGPGISGNERSASFVRRLATHCPLPLVLDADGLNAFAGHNGELQPRGDSAPLRVLTPHPGEAARLLGVSAQQINADRTEVARCIASQTGSCVVLKGHRTIVAGASGETWINMTGNPAMAKGGSGDVLSGILGAALARKRVAAPPGSRAGSSDSASAFLKDLHVAAAVYLHGLAGDLARDRLHEHTVLATDQVEMLTEAFRECRLQTDGGLFYLQR